MILMKWASNSSEPAASSSHPSYASATRMDAELQQLYITGRQGETPASVYACKKTHPAFS